jgi:hypothetical protein
VSNIGLGWCGETTPDAEVEGDFYQFQIMQLSQQLGMERTMHVVAAMYNEAWPRNKKSTAGKLSDTIRPFPINHQTLTVIRGNLMAIQLKENRHHIRTPLRQNASRSEI